MKPMRVDCTRGRGGGKNVCRILLGNLLENGRLFEKRDWRLGMSGSPNTMILFIETAEIRP
jgi:hypothetical protein